MKWDSDEEDDDFDEKLWLLRGKAAALLDQVPYQGDIWFELENSLQLTWDERENS